MPKCDLGFTCIIICICLIFIPMRFCVQHQIKRCLSLAITAHFIFECLSLKEKEKNLRKRHSHFPYSHTNTHTDTDTHPNTSLSISKPCKYISFFILGFGEQQVFQVAQNGCVCDSRNSSMCSLVLSVQRTATENSPTSVHRDPKHPNPLHQNTRKVYRGPTTLTSVLTSAGEFKCAHTGCCMFLWWFIHIFCVQILLKKKKRKHKQINENNYQNEVEDDVELSQREKL